MTLPMPGTAISKSYTLILCLLVACLGIAFVSSGCRNSIEEPSGELDMSETVILQTD